MAQKLLDTGIQKSVLNLFIVRQHVTGRKMVFSILFKSFIYWPTLPVLYKEQFRQSNKERSNRAVWARRDIGTQHIPRNAMLCYTPGRTTTACARERCLQNVELENFFCHEVLWRRMCAICAICFRGSADLNSVCERCRRQCKMKIIMKQLHLIYVN